MFDALALSDTFKVFAGHLGIEGWIGMFARLERERYPGLLPPSPHSGSPEVMTVPLIDHEARGEPG